MIKSFSISNYKIHKEAYQFDFDSVNVLTGANHSGKSSLIEAIHLLCYWATNTVGYSRLPIEILDSNVQVKDILNKEQSRKEHIKYDVMVENSESSELFHIIVEFVSNTEIGLDILGSSILLLYKLEVSCADGDYTFVLDEHNVSMDVLYKVYINKNDISELQNFKLKFQGLNAVFSSYGVFLEQMNEISIILRKVYNSLFEHRIYIMQGMRSAEPYNGMMLGQNYRNDGANAAEIIEMNKNKKCFDGSQTVQEAFEYWVKKILGYDIQIRYNNNQFYFVVNEDGITFRLNQSGRGISQILPIITMIVLANRDDFLMIENPEIHLHPKWKTELLELIKYASTYNIQFLIETQSLEIVNRIRLLGKNNDEFRKNANVWFFEKQKFECHIRKMELLENGGFDYWPEDFVDKVTLIDSMGLM